jgi:hypothetical protein
MKDKIQIETAIGKMDLELETNARIFTDEDGLMWLVIEDGNFAYRINRVPSEYCPIVEEAGDER